ncbi:MAG: serine/threonine protein kinase, partial [Planctomycetales bacterium]|nr:serine/threonine protein kinase [Planctomycetales bacterium]
AERLRLFIQVCKAVQHAHQKGIIHRDIKPSNVLVALHDNSPVPKVIDFGVSKAINQSLTDRTIYTGLHAALGTLAYMAPEQAALTNQDIDTRADVYGLGVLLYELLTGTTPHDPNRLNRAALDEAIRILREEEPPKASTKLSSLGVTATAVSAKRQTDPLGLQRLVRGDLDWILLKALEKDRSRRYETAGALAREIQRLLDHEPVEARPPSTSYRVQKFVRRNKASVTVAVTVFLLTIAGITGTSVGLIRTIRANRALGERNKELGEAYFREALTNVIFGNEAKAGEVIRDARDRELLSDAQIEMLEGQRDLYYGGAGDASDHLRKACELAPGAVLPRAMLVTAFALGKDLGYMQTLEEAEMLASSEKLSVVDKLFLGQARMYRNTESGLPLLREASDEWRSPLGEAILADALTHRANETADISLANQAIRRSQNASAWLTDSAYATTVDLWAHIVFLRLIDPTDPSHGRRASEASKLAQRLEQFPNCIVGQSVRAMYYYEAGDYEAVENMSVSPTPDYIMALVKYRKQDPSMVERLRNGEKQGSNPINQWSLAYTVGFEDSSDAEIHHIYAELHQFRAGYEKWWLPESILLLQHDHEFRRRECKRRLSEVGLSDWERLAVRYIGDDDGVSAEELTMKGAMNGRREEARAHLIIGMKKLLLGATGAEEHLLEAS